MFLSIADWATQYLDAAGPFFIYIFLGLLIFVETGILVAFFLPGDSILFAAGLVAASRDDINIVFLVFVIFLGAFIGDQFGYVLGRKYGRAYLEKKDFEKVVAVAKLRAENNPTNAQLLVQLAAAYLTAGNRSASIDSIKAAIALDPKFKEQGEFYIQEISAGRNP